MATFPTLTEDGGYPFTEEIQFGNIQTSMWGKERRRNKWGPKRAFKVLYDHMSHSDMDQLWTFFTDRKGTYEKFSWTHPISSVTYQVRFAEDGLRRSEVAPDVYSVEMTLVCVYTAWDVSANCVAQWMMNDNAASTTVVDSQGSHNGTAQQNTSSLATSGKINGALTFDGSTDYIQISDSDDFNIPVGTDFSVSAWINIASLPTGGDMYGIVSDGGGYGDKGWTLFLLPDSGSFNRELRWEFIDNDSTNNSCDSTTIPVTNTWYHVTGVYDGASSKMYIYINGVKESTTEQAYVAIEPLTDLAIGRNLGANSASRIEFMNGEIDDVCIFNKALSADEVYGLYNQGYGTEKLSG